ncbi:hypothetical protein PanWU01x14_108780, partial [Parasponia andersonii]
MLPLAYIIIYDFGWCLTLNADGITKDDVICCVFTHVFLTIGSAIPGGDRRRGMATRSSGTYFMPMMVFGRETMRGRKRGFGVLREKDEEVEGFK